MKLSVLAKEKSTRRTGYDGTRKASFKFQRSLTDLGLGLKDALYLLENIGLKVEAKGKGKVIYQSLTQNTDFHKGQSINLQLN